MLFIFHLGTPTSELITDSKEFPEPPLELMSDSVPIEDPSKVDDSLEPGTQRQYSLSDFELIKVIGRGSYAKVLMVELKKTGRIYAMKVIKKALVTDDEVIKCQSWRYLFLQYVGSLFLIIIGSVSNCKVT